MLEVGTGRFVPTVVHPRMIGLAPPGAGLAMSALTGLDAHVEREEERFGMTVSAEGGPSIWLDSPERVLTP
ncbi:hypothetical protein [Nonomuraea fuscirosea]|uniref:hypothetical protein n=1 Tax=Nonomuraea fuscirosea TaxID=1291556 RepID=UPI003447A0A1